MCGMFCTASYETFLWQEAKHEVEAVLIFLFSPLGLHHPLFSRLRATDKREKALNIESQLLHFQRASNKSVSCTSKVVSKKC